MRRVPGSAPFHVGIPYMMGTVFFVIAVRCSSQIPVSCACCQTRTRWEASSTGSAANAESDISPGNTTKMERFCIWNVWSRLQTTAGPATAEGWRAGCGKAAGCEGAVRRCGSFGIGVNARDTHGLQAAYRIRQARDTPWKCSESSLPRPGLHGRSRREGAGGGDR